MRHRPIGIGVQGLADVFILLGMPFDSEEGRQLNRDIFEAIYFHSLKTSCQLAEEEGTYGTYPGSPVSKVSLLCFVDIGYSRPAKCSSLVLESGIYYFYI